MTFACSGTIVVPEIVLDQDTAIDGTGHAVTLSGNRVNRVLSMSSGVTVELTGITVANGATGLDAGSGANGAGVYNGGTLTLTNSTVSGNSARMGHGGGIFASSGSLTNSTVSDNSTGYGAGAGMLLVRVTSAASRAVAT